MAVMMTGQRVGMVVRPPTGGGLLAVEGWGGGVRPGIWPRPEVTPATLGGPLMRSGGRWLCFRASISRSTDVREAVRHTVEFPVSRQYPEIAQRRMTLRRQYAGLPGAAASRRVDSLRFPKHR